MENRSNHNPLKISCSQCGAPIGFDIINQSYACKHCGTLAKLPDIEEGWTDLSEMILADTKESVLEEHCPSCGAVLLFEAGEASTHCDFCGGNLVKGDFGEGRLPKLILPFVITKEEAKKRLLDFAKQKEKMAEGKFILSNIDKLKGYYLPYELVRGSVSCEVSRQNTFRTYQCRGYLEGTAVNTSKQLDNRILNLAEPFDWSKARPFSFGYIAGQGVKLCDITPEEIKKRTQKEVKDDFLPEVEKVMQTTGVDLKIDSDQLFSMPILVPMYFIKVGEKTAVLNGQTGRIVASLERHKKSFPWVIEPLLYTILATFFLNLPFHFHMELLISSGMVFAMMFFAAMTDGRHSLLRTVFLRSRSSKARRVNGELQIEEGKDILKNPYDNTPVFVEENEQGILVPVKIRFYSFLRLFGVFLRMLLMMSFPILVAGVIRFLMIVGTDEPFLQYFEIKFGAAWFVLFGFICIIYWIVGVRRDVYERPLLYERMDNGRLRLLGSRASRCMGLLSLIGVGKMKKDGTRQTLFGLLRELGGAGVFLVCFIAFLLLGCVGAILF